MHRLALDRTPDSLAFGSGQMQGGNDVDYPGVISRNCQRSRCAGLKVHRSFSFSSCLSNFFASFRRGAGTLLLSFDWFR